MGSDPIRSWAPGVSELVRGDIGGAIKGSRDNSYFNDLVFGYDRIKELTAKPPQVKPPEAPNYKKPSFSMPEMPAFDFNSMQADLEAQKLAQEKELGLKNMNDLYAAKFEAANKATAQVNQQIADEFNYAKLRGLDYVSPDEDAKLSRINKVFATLWSSEQENQLLDLTNKWGSGENVWDTGITREEGNTTSIVSGGQKAGQKVSTTKATKPQGVEDDEKLGGVTTMLG